MHHEPELRFVIEPKIKLHLGKALGRHFGEGTSGLQPVCNIQCSHARSTAPDHMAMVLRELVVRCPHVRFPL